MNIEFLITKNFEKRNIYHGYLCEIKKENGSLAIRAINYTLGCLKNNVFYDFVDEQIYELLEFENGPYEEGIYFLNNGKLYDRKIENIPFIKVSPILALEEYKLKNEKKYEIMRKRFR